MARVVPCLESMARLSYLHLAWLPMLASAQQTTVGFVGGAPAEPPIGRSADTLPFVLGPTVSVELTRGLSLQSGLLFHRLGTSSQEYAIGRAGGGLSFGADRWKASAIEIPLLLRYHFLSRSRTWRPFVSAGPTVRRTVIEQSGVSAVSATVVAPWTRSKWNVDPAADVGVSFRSGRFAIEPEIRYSYWGAGKHDVIRKNQVHFLFGLRF
jgi:hypothetical protein